MYFYRLHDNDNIEKYPFLYLFNHRRYRVPAVELYSISGVTENEYRYISLYSHFEYRYIPHMFTFIAFMLHVAAHVLLIIAD